MDIPQFKDFPEQGQQSSPHFREFWRQYNELSSIYVTLLKRMARSMYGPHHTLDRLDSKAIDNMRCIIDSALYGALNRFEADHPEYKNNGALFVNSNSLKETIISALQEVNHGDGE